MSQQVYDIETVGFGPNTLGGYFDFYVNNTFYLFAPPYYQSFYSLYLNRALAVYDGWINGWHNTSSGLVPQRALQSVARGLNNMLFAHGVDFNGDGSNYNFAVKWAKKSKFYKAIKKAHLFAVAGGTSLLKVNRRDKELYVTAHRIDTFYADISPDGKVQSVKVYFDAMHDMNSQNGEKHYGICEERYFNEEGKACVRSVCYLASANLQTETQARPTGKINLARVKWQNLPQDIKRQIKENYPSILLDEEQYLPFANSLGCYLMKFTEDIGQVPNTPLGQPIGDILLTESFQYDQMKYFEKNEVDLARARALIPEEMWNKDDPIYDDRALNERFYQKVSSVNGDTDKVTPIQFDFRAESMRIQKENILRDMAFKLNVSTSSIASFLGEGSSAKTATEIINERTKSDTWIDSQINLNKADIDEMLSVIMRYYNVEPVEIIFKVEEQAPQLEMLKVWGDQLTVGNITPELFVRKVHKNLTLDEQRKEIELLTEQKAMRDSQKLAMTNIYNSKT